MAPAGAPFGAQASPSSAAEPESAAFERVAAGAAASSSGSSSAPCTLPRRQHQIAAPALAAPAAAAPPPQPRAPRPPRLKVVSLGATASGKSCLVKRFCEGRFVSRYVPTIGADYGVKPLAFGGVEASARARTHTQVSCVWDKRAGHRGASKGLLCAKQRTLAKWLERTSTKHTSLQRAATYITKNPTPTPHPIQVRVDFWDLAGPPEYAEARAELYRGARALLLVFDAGSRAGFESLSAWLDEARRHGALSGSSSGGGSSGGGGGGCAVVVAGTKADAVAAAGARRVAAGEARAWAAARGLPYFEVRWEMEGGRKAGRALCDWLTGAARYSMHSMQQLKTRQVNTHANIQNGFHPPPLCLRLRPCARVITPTQKVSALTGAGVGALFAELFSRALAHCATAAGGGDARLQAAAAAAATQAAEAAAAAAAEAAAITAG